MDNSEYNGYKNYETWNVCLWIANDEGLYNLSMACANYDEFVGTLRELDCLETSDGVAWNDSGLDIDANNEACFSEDAEDDEGPGAGSADDTLAGSGATIAPSAAAPMDEPVSTAGTNPAAAQKLRQIGNAVVFIQPMKTPREGEGGGDDV